MATLGRGSHRSLAGMNSATVRERNRSAVFEAIRHYAPISRKALAIHSGLNPATVTHIVDELLSAGVSWRKYEGDNQWVNPLRQVQHDWSSQPIRTTGFPACGLRNSPQ